MISNETRQKWQKAVGYLMEYGDGHMDEWEANFLDSISIRLSVGLDLTFKQSSKLYKIWHRVEEEVG